VRLFLDSSVMIAGAASAEGASRSVFRLAGTHEWRLVTTPYAVEETVRNLAAFAPSVTASWLRLRSQLVVVDDVVTIDKPAVFPVEKADPFSSVPWHRPMFFWRSIALISAAFLATCSMVSQS